MSVRNEAKTVTVSGIVQGVGFRPFVYQLARRHRLKGEVANTSAGVLIHVEGAGKGIRAFCRDLTEQPPPLARITDLSVSPAFWRHFSDFVIAESRGDAAGSTLISPDVSLCEACAGEGDGPGKPAVSLPVHQLHQLRSPLYHY